MSSKFSEIKKNMKWADGSIPRVAYLLSVLSVVHIWLGLLLSPLILISVFAAPGSFFILLIFLFGIFFNYSVNYSIMNRKKWVYYFYSIMICIMVLLSILSLALSKDITIILSILLYGLLLFYFVIDQKTREYFRIIRSRKVKK
ncbi:MAG: hypothetical protein ACI83O_000819 [Patescibacteria group bacterium]|jgi:hypothetical protein